MQDAYSGADGNPVDRGLNKSHLFTQRTLLVFALCVMALLPLVNDRHLARLLLIGIILQHAAFGFTSAYRRYNLHRETAALHPRLIMSALTTLLFAPAGSALGVRWRPRFELAN